MKSCVPGDSQKTSAIKSNLWDAGASVTGINDFLTEKEADHLIKLSSENCSASKVIGNNKTNVSSSSRTSTSCFINKGADEVVQCIEKKIADLAGRHVTHLEPLQVTRYKKGQQYKAHFDYFAKPENGQRTTTVFTYLKGLDEHCGGATAFSELKTNGEPLRVRPIAGNAVLWENLHSNGKGNKLTMHGGEPVLCDAEKIGLNAWFQDQKWQ